MANLSSRTLDLMDELLDELYSHDQLPGISAIITHYHETIWSKSYGFADLDSKKIADLNTIYHIGSVTKIFTAIMLMQLRDAGKLQLDEPLSRYLPEIQEVTHLPITLKQLTSHTSGLPMMPPIEELSTAMQEFPPSLETLKNMKVPSIEAIINALPQVELLAPPGTQVGYSNLGIALLAHAMERIAGQEYASYIEEQVLRPLSMNQSGFSSAIRDSVNRTVCYLPFSSPPEAAPFETKMIAGFVPAGALWSSANDMGRFLTFLTNPQQMDALSPISSSSLNAMYQMIAPLEASRYTEAVTDSGVGTGWFLSRIQNHLLAEHGGADPSTSAYLAWVPELNLATFIAANTGKNPTSIAVAATNLLESVILALKRN
jgi:CubicO group peptidase (beta-lactamase class C family)